MAQLRKHLRQKVEIGWKGKGKKVRKIKTIKICFLNANYLMKKASTFERGIFLLSSWIKFLKILTLKVESGRKGEGEG